MIDSPARSPLRTLPRSMVCLLGALTMAGCVALAESAVGVEPDVDPGTSDGTLAAIAAGLQRAANQMRADSGLVGLRADPALNRAAMKYAQELAWRGVLDHRSATPRLETLTKRIEASGGTWLEAGENLARLGGPAERAGGYIVELWMTSPSHRRNLMNPRYTHVGSGAARATRREWVTVQVYVVPRSVPWE
jgi:uncharacterized protein YkwD